MHDQDRVVPRCLRAPRVCPLILSLLALGACSESDGGSKKKPSAPFDEVRQPIGPEGGTLEADDGKIRLLVPPRALTETTEISIAPSVQGPPSGAISAVYDLGPDGLTFERPAHLVLTKSGSPAAGKTPVVATSDDDDDQWTSIDASLDDGSTVFAQVEHFSKVVILPTGSPVPFEPVTNFTVVPAERTEVITPSWTRWETMGDGLVQVSGNANPAATMGRWFGATTGEGTFPVANGTFSFQLDLLQHGGGVGVTVLGASHEATINCVGGCMRDAGAPDAGSDGGDAGVTDSGGGDGGPPLADFGCALVEQESADQPAGSLVTAGSFLYAGHRVPDSHLFQIGPSGALTSLGPFLRIGRLFSSSTELFGVGFNRLRVMSVGAGPPTLAGEYSVPDDAALQSAMSVTDQINPVSSLAMAHSNGFAYLPVEGRAANGMLEAQSFIVVDVTNAASPSRVGFLLLNDYPLGTAVAPGGAMVYVTTDAPSVLAIDVSNPTTPTLRATLPLPAAPTHAIDLEGTNLVVGYGKLLGANDGGLFIIDVSTPDAPALVGNVPTRGRSPSTVDAFGTWAFTVSVDGLWLGAYRLTDPANPTVTGGKVLTAGGLPALPPYPVVLFGAWLYTSTQNGITRIEAADCFVP